MSTTSTSSVTERSPARSSSMRRRRVGSARIWNASGMAIHYYSDICPVNNILSSLRDGLSLTPDGRAQECRQLIKGSRRRAERPSPAVPARFPSLSDHIEDPVLPVHGEIEPGHDAFAVQ